MFDPLSKIKKKDNIIKWTNPIKYLYKIILYLMEYLDKFFISYL